MKRSGFPEMSDDVSRGILGLKRNKVPWSISTASLQTPLFIKSCSRIAYIPLCSCTDGDFAAVILTPSKACFSTMDLDNDYYSGPDDVKT
jgi:hypothetical protein